MKLFDKIWNALGLVESEDLVEETQSKPALISNSDKKSEKTVKHFQEPKPLLKPLETTTVGDPSSDRKKKLVLTQLDHFDDSRQIAEHLTSGKLVVVNFERTDSETTKRTIDFMSGITYAVGGTVQRISAAIFMFAPANVQIMTTETMGQENLTLSASWRGQTRGREQ